MPVTNLSSPSGFSKDWDDVVTAFREVAIDTPMSSGNLTDLNDHVKGPVTGETLAAQYAYPLVWSVPRSWTANYETTAADHGVLQVQVIIFAKDEDQEYAFRKARHLLGNVVTNVEADRSLSGGTTDAAGKVGRAEMTNFQMDFTLSTGQGQRAQLTWGQALFDLHVKRLL